MYGWQEERAALDSIEQTQASYYASERGRPRARRRHLVNGSSPILLLVFLSGSCQEPMANEMIAAVKWVWAHSPDRYLEDTGEFL